MESKVSTMMMVTMEFLIPVRVCYCAILIHPSISRYPSVTSASFSTAETLDQEDDKADNDPYPDAKDMNKLLFRLQPHPLRRILAVLSRG